MEQSPSILLKKLVTNIVNYYRNVIHLPKRWQWQRRVVNHTPQYEEVVLFTQVYHFIWRHVYPILEEFVRLRPKAAVVLLTNAADYSIITSQQLCKSNPQICCTFLLPKTISNLKVAFSMSPDNALDIPTNFKLTPEVVKCVLQHGLADKCAFGEFYETKPVHDYDVIFLAGPVFWKGSLKSYCEKYPEFLETRTVLEAGLCRTDSLVRWGEDCHPERSGSDKRKPTIIYAPTWQTSASMEAHGDEILRRLVQFHGEVIIRPHPLTLSCGKCMYGFQRQRSGEEWINMLESLEAQHPHIKFSRDIDPDKDFFAADLMISDASGAAFEFLLMDKPLVFIDTPEFFQDEGMKSIQYWGRFAGDIVYDLDQLLNVVWLNLKDPARKVHERKSLKKQLLYNPGHAAESIAKHICNILDNPNSYLKRNHSCTPT